GVVRTGLAEHRGAVIGIRSRTRPTPGHDALEGVGGGRGDVGLDHFLASVGGQGLVLAVGTDDPVDRMLVAPGAAVADRTHRARHVQRRDGLRPQDVERHVLLGDRFAVAELHAHPVGDAVDVAEVELLRHREEPAVERLHRELVRRAHPAAISVGVPDDVGAEVDRVAVAGQLVEDAVRAVDGLTKGVALLQPVDEGEDLVARSDREAVGRAVRGVGRVDERGVSRLPVERRVLGEGRVLHHREDPAGSGLDRRAGGAELQALDRRRRVLGH
ncbi:hypothetical protein ABE10_00815, partial [Bacillus toyonensis]|nr:hypothetical protein [Bacillus toyonensis]